MRKVLLTFILALSLSACGAGPAEIPDVTDPAVTTWNDLTITSTAVTPVPFVGIGPQWGGYDNLYAWTGSATLRAEDWNKLLARMDFMHPGLIRIMGSQGWNYMKNGMYNPEKSKDILFRILDYCQNRGISVMVGEWGEPELAGNKVDTLWLTRAVNFLEYMIHTKSYTCLKFYNMCNEPAGSWSSIGGDYDLWQRTYQEIFKRLEAKGLDREITVIAPDIAVWNDYSLTNWITRAMVFFGEKIGAYDIHTYPPDERVKNGAYKDIITGYRQTVPLNKPVIMGELGYKYASGTVHEVENLSRIAKDPYASDDSNMMVYDAFYGIDMADAVIQNLDAGFSGVILWDLDDAMYDTGNLKLKRWGFWNILGEEKFGSSTDENIRPWFYTMSLLCRYFPAGSTILKATLPNKQGISAVAGVKGGKYTIAVSNSNKKSYTLNLKMNNGIVLKQASCFNFVASETGPAFKGKLDANGFPKASSIQDIDLREDHSYTLHMDSLSFVLISNMEIQ